MSLVCVRWIDSSIDTAQVDEEDLPTPRVLVTMGHLSQQTDEHIVVSRDESPHPRSFRWRGNVAIPRCAIVAISVFDVLSEPEGRVTNPDAPTRLLPLNTPGSGAFSFGVQQPGSSDPMPPEKRAEYKKRIEDAAKSSHGGKASEIFVRDTERPGGETCECDSCNRAFPLSVLRFGRGGKATCPECAEGER